VIAKAARAKGILTIGVITKPFHFEGTNRMRTAEKGIEELQQYVDTLIVIPNQNLFRVANEKTTFADAFKMADDVLYSGVRSITDLMMKPGLINLDFADVRAVMGDMMGKAMMGTGEAQGEGRAIEAAEAAISSPLLDDVSMRGAKAVLINITGGLDMTLYEVDEAANRIREEVDPDAHIIFGSTFDEALHGKIRVSCVATGIDGQAVVKPKPRFAVPEKEASSPASLISNVEPIITADIAANLQQDILTTELEGEIPNLGAMDLAPSPLSLETQYPANDLYTSLPQETEKPLSFFDRLLGRKNVAAASSRPELSARARMSSVVESDTTMMETGEEEAMDIPAFLRRQAK